MRLLCGLLFNKTPRDSLGKNIPVSLIKCPAEGFHRVCQGVNKIRSEGKQPGSDDVFYYFTGNFEGFFKLQKQRLGELLGMLLVGGSITVQMFVTNSLQNSSLLLTFNVVNGETPP